MRIFALSPSYLFVAGDGVHERRIAEVLRLTDQLFITTFNVLLPPARKFTGSIGTYREGRFLSLPVIRPIIVFDFFYGMLFSVIFTFYRLVGKKPFDVIYIRDISAAIGINTLRRYHRIPVVLKLGGFVADEYFGFPRGRIACMVSWAISVMERVTTIKSDKVIVPSSLFKIELMKRYGVSGTKIVPLSAGVNIKEFSAPIDSKKSESPFTIGYFGSLADLNDIDCLLKALQLLKPRVNIKLLLSTRNDHTEITRKIYLYGLKELVEIKSTPHNLVPKLMNKVDVIVIPRRRLSSTDLVIPLKLLEAGAARKPVVIAKTRIIKHTLQDNKNVIMYAPEDSEDLAEKILQLYKDETLRTNLGKALFEYAKDYKWDNILGNLRKILLHISLNDAKIYK